MAERFAPPQLCELTLADGSPFFERCIAALRHGASCHRRTRALTRHAFISLCNFIVSARNHNDGPPCFEGQIPVTPIRVRTRSAHNGSLPSSVDPRLSVPESNLFRNIRGLRSSISIPHAFNTSHTCATPTSIPVVQEACHVGGWYVRCGHLIRRKFRQSGIDHPQIDSRRFDLPGSKSCLPVLPDSMFRYGSAISLTFGQCRHLTFRPEPCRLLDRRPDPPFVRGMFSSCSLSSHSISSHGTCYSEVSNAHLCRKLAQSDWLILVVIAPKLAVNAILA